MSNPEQADFNAILARFAAQGRSALLPALQAAQKKFGFISEPVATQVARALSVSLAEVHGVIEFYAMLYSEPVGKRIIRVCTDPACALAGGEEILVHLCAKHKLNPGETSTDGALTVERAPCLGLCDHAPAALVDEQAETRIDLAQDRFALGMPPSRVTGPLRWLTARCGHGFPAFLASYGAYTALDKVFAMPPIAVIEEIQAAGLVGRGGAAFPTAVKWQGAADAPGLEKFVVCNADESEPGTFKDRVLLSDDPHAIIEGMCIAAYAIGARQGYIYLRGEYPYLVATLEKALTEAHQAGYLGTRFEIELRLGAGAYICGEETALFESIEGKRGFPRVKPPFPTTQGLFNKPTVINNVETLANVPLIIQHGAGVYRSVGSTKSPGPKLFCLSGDVNEPGVVEAPFGLTLGELIEQAGGVNGELQAVLFGGAAGAFATPSQLDVPLTFEDLRTAGLPLGSGVVMVFNNNRDLRQVLHQLGRFFAHESCGKCYPCQLGTQRQLEILERYALGRPLPGDVLRLQDVGWTMSDASLCGLGQTAASAVLSAMRLWPELFTEPTHG